MNYLSVCSGIEAATVAWHPLGWEPVAFSEIEPFPSQVLKHHYPGVENVGDMTRFKEWNFGKTVELLVGGTPCQSFSVAGLRKGLDDPRGNLALTYCGILDKFRPKWCLWENVPGVLSSNGGKDFGAFLGALAELGYGFAYRVLDAQHFGVAQRRRRVFVVGHLGDWKPAAEVLFEPESLRGDFKESRGKRKNSPDSIKESVGALCARDYKGVGNQYVDEGKCIVEPIVFENSRRDGVRLFGNISNTLQSFMGTGGGNVPMTTSYGIPGNWIGRKPKNGGNAINPMINKSPCLTKTDVHGVAHGLMAVRRLTPVECERLQGFPDNYTNIKESCPDGPRYKALGNSMAVPVMRWIGERIAMVDR